MPESDVIHTRKIAHLRVHVERAIGRVKEFYISKNTLPTTMWDSIMKLLMFVACCVTPPLVS